MKSVVNVIMIRTKYSIRGLPFFVIYSLFPNTNWYKMCPLQNTIPSLKSYKLYVIYYNLLTNEWPQPHPIWWALYTINKTVFSNLILYDHYDYLYYECCYHRYNYFHCHKFDKVLFFHEDQTLLISNTVIIECIYFMLLGFLLLI